jgi:hypothetical protein
MSVTKVIARVHTGPLRGATLAVAGAVLAVAFLPGAVAVAEPEDDLVWYRDFSEFTLTSQTMEPLGIFQQTGNGPLDGWSNASEPATLVLPDELQADETGYLVPWLDDYEFETYDITGGDAAIPTGSVIDVSVFPSLILGSETIEIPGAGLFGLPETIETLFDASGSFSF